MARPSDFKTGIEAIIQAWAGGFGKARPFVRRGCRCAQLPEKCAVNARANEPKPPRVTVPESVVPDVERPEEASLLKRPLRDE
jgi:hypothetical protein